MSYLSKNKRDTKKYGLLPPKEAEAVHWETLCVDMIGPYTIRIKNTNYEVTLHCVTMIDPATGWFEMKPTSEKDSTTVANIVETTWLSRYPWPQKILF